MTFLEYVCHRLIGKPVSGSCWRCPFCCSTGGSFFVRTQQQKFKCYHCGGWGDACDLLKLFHPQDDYGKRLERLRELQDDYKRETTLIHPGSMKHMNQRSADKRDPCEAFNEPANNALKALLKWPEVMPDDAALMTMLRFAAASLRACAEFGVHPEAFAERLVHQSWIQEHYVEHGRPCDDPDCDEFACRIARGWTEEEIRADIERHKRRTVSSRKG